MAGPWAGTCSPRAAKATPDPSTTSARGQPRVPGECVMDTRGTSGCRPSSWERGIHWHPYDGDIDIFRAGEVRGKLSRPSFPALSATRSPGVLLVAGPDRDSHDMGLSTHYEENLVSLIRELRAPSAAHPRRRSSLHRSARPLRGRHYRRRPDPARSTHGAKYPEFKGSAAAVYCTTPLGNTLGASGAHYDTSTVATRWARPWWPSSRATRRRRQS